MFENHLSNCIQVFLDAKKVVGVMLCYNTFFCKDPKTQKKDDRKQMVEDLKSV